MTALNPPALPELAPCGEPLVDPHRVPAIDTPSSFGSMETMFGDFGLSLWGDGDSSIPDSANKVQLQLAPARPVVIGRMQDDRPPYLDPAYRPTRVVPGSGQSVVRSATEGKDVCVSRAHFMLRGCIAGITLTNGVPRRGGGIRPPVNNTWLLQPIRRSMAPGEEYLIEHGASVVIWLVNGTTVRINAG